MNNRGALYDLTLADLPPLPQTVSLSRVAHRLWARPDVAALWLGGSFARREADAYSDVDLRVAVQPKAFAAWERPDFEAIFDGSVVGSRLLTFVTEAWLYYLVLANGEMYDLWVQSVSQAPPQDTTLVLGCRDPVFADRLAIAEPPSPFVTAPAQANVTLEMITDYWMGTLKHCKTLGRGLDTLAIKGVELERAVLQRLWYALATGHDFHVERPTIHALTLLAHVVQAEFGEKASALLGAPLTCRLEIIQAIEDLHREISRGGQELAGRLGFLYPHTLEAVVLQRWKVFQEETREKGERKSLNPVD